MKIASSLRFGDSLIEFCCFLYVSRIAWQRGHVIAVPLIWILAILGNAIGARIQKRYDDAVVDRFEKMKEKLERRKLGAES